MNLLPTPEQQQIADSIVDFLSAEAPASRFLDRSRPHASAERTLWAAYADLGWLGLGLEEDLGGAGAGAAEDALLFRELGRYLASPNVLAARIGAETAARAGDIARARAIVAGEIGVAIANPVGRVVIGPKSTGRFHLLEARPGDLLLGWNADGAALTAFEAFEAVETLPGLDEGVGLATGELREAGAVAWVSADACPLPDLATVMVAAMSCGVAEATLAETLEYVNFREQFGRKIGSFQAVKHRCADMAVLSEAAWAQTVMAALSLSRDRSSRMFETAAARLAATRAALGCAEANIQLHGGLGFTAECPAHLFMKRARLLEQIGGDPRSHRSALITRPAAVA